MQQPKKKVYVLPIKTVFSFHSYFLSDTSSYQMSGLSGDAVAIGILEICTKGIWIEDMFIWGLVGYVYVAHSHFQEKLSYCELSHCREGF